MEGHIKKINEFRKFPSSYKELTGAGFFVVARKVYGKKPLAQR